MTPLSILELVRVTQETDARGALDNAREHGVQVHEGTRVLEVLMEGERAVGVRVMDDAGIERIVRAQVVVDASGQSAMRSFRNTMRLPA